MFWMLGGGAFEGKGRWRIGEVRRAVMLHRTAVLKHTAVWPSVHLRRGTHCRPHDDSVALHPLPFFKQNFVVIVDVPPFRGDDNPFGVGERPSFAISANFDVDLFVGVPSREISTATQSKPTPCSQTLSDS